MWQVVKQKILNQQKLDRAAGIKEIKQLEENYAKKKAGHADAEQNKVYSNNVTD